jgi:hypothetical protein
VAGWMGLTKKEKCENMPFPSFHSKNICLSIYVVYTGCPITHGIVKTIWGRTLNDNVESCEVSHFEAKDHTFQSFM